VSAPAGTLVGAIVDAGEIFHPQVDAAGGYALTMSMRWSNGLAIRMPRTGAYGPL
jgi:hypothetical protein